MKKKGRTKRKRERQKIQESTASTPCKCFCLADNTCVCEKSLRKKPHSVAQEQNIVQMCKWLKTKGLHLSKFLLRPTYFPDTGRGIMAQRTLNEGDTIISIPKHLLLTTETVLASKVGNIIKCNKQKLSPVQALCVFLIHEQQMGTSSPWKPYIDVLPSDYTSIVHWTVEEINLLPKSVRTKAMEKVQSAKDSYTSLKRNFIKIFEKEFPKMTGMLTWEKYVWAWSSVNTRCVFMSRRPSQYLNSEEDHYALAPFLDLLNHSAEVEVDAAFDEKTQCYTIKTCTPCAKYQQIFISYGPHANHRLLLEYGFILPQNPNNAVVLTLDAVLEYIEGEECVLLLKEKKSDILLSNNLNIGLGCSMDGLSWNLLTCLRICAMDYKELCIWRNCLQGPLSDHNEEKMKRLAQVVLKGCLADLPDHPRMADADVSEHCRLARALCDEYTAILTHCLEEVT